MMYDDRPLKFYILAVLALFFGKAAFATSLDFEASIDRILAVTKSQPRVADEDASVWKTVISKAKADGEKRQILLNKLALVFEKTPAARANLEVAGGSCSYSRAGFLLFETYKELGSAIPFQIKLKGFKAFFRSATDITFVNQNIDRGIHVPRMSRPLMISQLDAMGIKDRGEIQSVLQLFDSLQISEKNQAQILYYALRIPSLEPGLVTPINERLDVLASRDHSVNQELGRLIFAEMGSSICLEMDVKSESSFKEAVAGRLKASNLPSRLDSTLLTLAKDSCTKSRRARI